MSERTVVVSAKASNYHRVDNGEEGRIAVCGGFKESKLETMSEIEALREGYDPCDSCRWLPQPEQPPEDIPHPVYITASAGNSRHYHEDKEDCKRVSRGNRKEPRKVSENAIRYHELTPCPDCSMPEYEPPEVAPRIATDGGPKQASEQRRCASCGLFIPEDRAPDLCVNCDDGPRADGGTDPTGTERTRRFRVDDLRDDAAWLTLLEGEKQGLQFGVRYGDFRDELSEGDEIVATVESLNERNTEWIIRDLQMESERDE